MKLSYVNSTPSQKQLHNSSEAFYGFFEKYSYFSRLPISGFFFHSPKRVNELKGTRTRNKTSITGSIMRKKTHLQKPVGFTLLLVRRELQPKSATWNISHLNCSPEADCSHKTAFYSVCHSGWTTRACDQVYLINYKAKFKVKRKYSLATGYRLPPIFKKLPEQ